MGIKVYNTLSRTKEDFVPWTAGRVTMYLCGPTVYKPSHIGHMVGPVIFDTIKRYLVYNGYQVTWVVNITDVDDKLINRARELNTSVEAIAREVEQDYFENLRILGVNGVDYFPRATEHIRDMQELIGCLISRGFAYVLDGDVYFDCTRDDDYGKLSRRSLEEMLAGTRVEPNDKKRHPADFALWKASKPGEPAWDSPWGPGRPGWHIECSAMARKLLGDSIDIHGGGLDLMFPHHENELAQSESCTGRPFARYWLHNGLMQSGRQAGKVGGAHDRHGDLLIEKQQQEAAKISKSTGASPFKELLQEFDPDTIRFFLLATHYRSPIDFSTERLQETKRSLEGFYRLIESYQRVTGLSFYELPAAQTRSEGDAACVPVAGTPVFHEQLIHLRGLFLEAMDDDFNTGAAVGVLFELRKVLNAWLHEQQLEHSARRPEDVTAWTVGMRVLRELTCLLGVFLSQRPRSSQPPDEGLVADLMKLLIDLRTEARKQKNFAVADQIRQRLADIQIILEDRPEGTRWRRIEG